MNYQKINRIVALSLIICTTGHNNINPVSNTLIISGTLTGMVSIACLYKKNKIKRKTAKKLILLSAATCIALLGVNYWYQAGGLNNPIQDHTAYEKEYDNLNKEYNKITALVLRRGSKITPEEISDCENTLLQLIGKAKACADKMGAPQTPELSSVLQSMKDFALETQDYLKNWEEYRKNPN